MVLAEYENDSSIHNNNNTNNNSSSSSSSNNYFESIFAVEDELFRCESEREYFEDEEVTSSSLEQGGASGRGIFSSCVSEPHLFDLYHHHGSQQRQEPFSPLGNYYYDGVFRCNHDDRTHGDSSSSTTTATTTKRRRRRLFLWFLEGFAASIACLMLARFFFSHRRISTSRSEFHTTSADITGSASPPTPSRDDPPLAGMTIWQEYRASRKAMATFQEEVFGSAVAIRENWVAIAESGSVINTQYQTPDSFWHSISITVPAGWGITDLGFAYNPELCPNPFLLVGAPSSSSRFKDDSNSNHNAAGSAFLFQFDADANQWNMLGDLAMAGIDDSDEERGAVVSFPKFGDAVAVSDSLRVVVGAPHHRTESAGRIFTYQYTPNDDNEMNGWSITTSAPTLTGTSFEFGSVLAQTTDGKVLAVGEPSSNRVAIYHWDDSRGQSRGQWVEFLVHQPEGTNANAPQQQNDEFGSSVTFLSSTLLAVGAPAAHNNTGMVSLLQRQNDTSSSKWEWFKNLHGTQPGDRFGAKGTVSGSLTQRGGITSPRLVVASHPGMIRRYDWMMEGSQFVLRFTIHIGATVTSIGVEDANDDDGGLVVLAGYGRSNLVALYGPSSVPL